MFQYDPSTATCVLKMDFTCSIRPYSFVNGNKQMVSFIILQKEEWQGRIVQYDPVTNTTVTKIELNTATNGKNPTGKLTRSQQR